MWDKEQQRKKREAEKRAKEKEQDEAEAEDILDGPPPELPPSIAPSDEPDETHLFKSTTRWAEAEPFSAAIEELLDLRTKPIERFFGVRKDRLDEVIEFLNAIKAANEKSAKQQGAAVASLTLERS
jgi:hypothetical protein